MGGSKRRERLHCKVPHGQSCLSGQLTAAPGAMLGSAGQLSKVTQVKEGMMEGRLSDSRITTESNNEGFVENNSAIKPALLGDTQYLGNI